MLGWEGEQLSDVHVFDILETVAQITKERVVQMLEHPSLTNDIPYTLRFDDWL